MILAPRRTYGEGGLPKWCRLGEHVLATPPTLRAGLAGQVTDISGYAITITTARGVEVAVDVEDCVPAPSPAKGAS